MKSVIAAFAAVVAVLMGVTLSLSKGDTGKYAYVDVARIVASANLQTQMRAYDREIAALKATQSVPQLADTRGVVRRQAQVVRAGANEARDTLAALRTRPPQPAAGAYRHALANEASSSLAGFRAGLQARTATAYAARSQQFAEHEATLEIRLERAVADRRLQLQLRLQNLKPPFADRAKLRSQIAAIDGAIAQKVDALRASDAAKLAAYKSKLDAQAASDYASAVASMKRKAQANLALHARVARAEIQSSTAPKQWQAAQFDAAGADIARRFTAVADADDAARGDAANQIIALQRAKAALVSEYRDTVIALASAIAKSRGLTLVDHPTPGAVDLTRAVRATLHPVSS